MNESYPGASPEPINPADFAGLPAEMYTQAVIDESVEPVLQAYGHEAVNAAAQLTESATAAPLGDEAEAYLRGHGQYTAARDRYSSAGSIDALLQYSAGK